MAGNVVAALGSLRKLMMGVVVCGLLSVAAVFAGPVMSGAVLLLLPAAGTAAGEMPDSYEPIHKGHVSLDTGLYIRENDDLAVPGNPPLVLRRTYLATYRVSKEFGVGTTHTGERYLIGDGQRFLWARLMRNGSSHIGFNRISSGTSVLNAMFEHRGPPDEWDGARLGWTGLGWALRRRDGLGRGVSVLVERVLRPGAVGSTRVGRDDPPPIGPINELEDVRLGVGVPVHLSDWGRIASAPATFTYERDPATNQVSSLTLTCPDRTGEPLRRSSLVKPGREEWLKWDLVQTYCAWDGQSWRAVE